MPKGRTKAKKGPLRLEKHFSSSKLTFVRLFLKNAFLKTFLKEGPPCGVFNRLTYQKRQKGCCGVIEKDRKSRDVFSSMENGFPCKNLAGRYIARKCLYFQPGIDRKIRILT